jgi:hypothetical protein
MSVFGEQLATVSKARMESGKKSFLSMSELRLIDVMQR